MFCKALPSSWGKFISKDINSYKQKRTRIHRNKKARISDIYRVDRQMKKLEGKGLSYKKYKKSYMT